MLHNVPTNCGLNNSYLPSYTHPSIGFADIVGHDAAKSALRRAIIDPTLQAELYKKCGLPAGGSALLFGPPGTGKTSLAEATAKEMDASFFSISASDILSKYVGGAEENIKAIFVAASKCKRALIFIDDCEQLMHMADTAQIKVGELFRHEFESRQKSGTEENVKAIFDASRRSKRELIFLDDSEDLMRMADSGQNKVGELFRLEIESRQNNSAISFLAATNEPWNISAPWQRLFGANRIYVRLPYLEDREAILAKKLVGVPLANDVNLKAIAQMTGGYSGADLAVICRNSKLALVDQCIKSGDLSSPLTQTILKAAVLSLRPIATAEMLARLQKWDDSFSK